MVTKINLQQYVKLIAQELDRKDDKKGKILAHVWNDIFSAKEKGGKEIKNYITVENAEKAISKYIKSAEKEADKQQDLAESWFNSLSEHDLSKIQETSDTSLAEELQNATDYLLKLYQETINEFQKLMEERQNAIFAKPVSTYVDNSKFIQSEPVENASKTNSAENKVVSNRASKTDKKNNLSAESDSIRIIQQNTKYEKIIAECSKEHNIDPLLIKCIIYQESKFDPNACSKRGAKGLMQLMPRTAKFLGVKNAYNPEQNINGGTKYFAYLMEKFNNNIQLALAAYNAGEGNVRNYGNRIPPFKQTRNYVKSILDNYEQIKQATSA